MGYHIEARYLPSRRGGPEMLSSPEEVDEFIDRLLAQPEEYNLASLYLVERLNPDDRFPSHQFQVGVHNAKRMGALKYVDANGGFASWAPWDAESTEPVYFNYVGTESEFPPASEIPIDHVRQAVKEFLSSGGQRPESVQWQEDTTL
jgi:hypothetical protein